MLFRSGATNEDLPAATAAGRFRADLLDRLAFEVITLPPLRARSEDIPLLAVHFGREMAKELNWPQFPGFTEEAVERLLAHSWPGNVRELRNAVERSVARGTPDTPVAEICIDPFASPHALAAPARAAAASAPLRAAARSGAAASAEAILPDPSCAFDLRGALKRVERDLLAQALAGQRYNQRATAKQLGLSYDQLRGRLRKHGLLGEGAEGGRN